MRDMNLPHSLQDLCILQLSLIRISYGLQCYNCSGITDVEECLTVTDCRSGQSCYMDRTVSGQTSSLGCTSNLRCGVSANGAGSLVGRDLDLRQIQDCHECCSTDKCNKNLCVHLKPGACIDDVKADCAWLNTMFNICKDIQHAKSVCPRFCALCSLVDGSWAAWSTWSTCDVTCENGTQTRTRTCTDPPPANGGLDCIGSGTDTKACLKELCPVHGGWTKWTSWEGCSVTCDKGLQKRHRNCTNPVPDRSGRQCLGDPFGVKMCSPGPCANGGWSDWGQWSTCSVSCGSGLKSRSRTCTNPRPSELGRYCEGDPNQVGMCTTTACVKNIAFVAHTVLDTSPSTGQTMIFGTALVNEGHAYNTSTGIFTAPANGTYSFSTQLCVYSQKQLYFAIIVDGVTYATVRLYDQNTDACNTAVTVAVLHANAKVWVKCTITSSGNIINQDTIYHINSFSGYLIHE